MKVFRLVLVLAALPFISGGASAPPKGDLAGVVVEMDGSSVEIGNIVSTGRAYLQKELPKAAGLDRLTAKVFVECGQQKRPFRLLLYGDPGERIYNAWVDSRDRAQAFESPVGIDTSRP